MKNEPAPPAASQKNRPARDGGEDIKVVSKCLQGDVEAFEYLVKKYQDPVYFIGYRMVGDREEAKDLAQETFVRAFEKLGTYNSRMPFRSWLYKICSNLTIDRLRGRKGREASARVGENVSPGGEDRDWGQVELAAPEKEIPENVSMDNDTSRMVQAALDELQENYRMVMVLHHMEGMSYAEISKILGVPRNTVKTWAHRARGELCNSLKGEV